MREDAAFETTIGPSGPQNSHMIDNRSTHPVLRRTDRFLERVLRLIEQETDLDTATRLAEWLALYLWENACGIYRLDAIEELILAKCLQHLNPLEPPPGDASELHVASKVFRSGGHTALMRCLMLESPHPTAALLTRTDQAMEGAEILGLRTSQVAAPSAAAKVADRIAFLAAQMLKHQRVFLHIHPDDVTCAVAVRMAKLANPALKIYFVNHADHVFSVGLSAADHILEISTYGWMLRPQRASIGQSSYIGIPITPPVPIADIASTAQDRYVLTGGASYKFRPLGSMSLPAALSKLLASEPTLRLVVIGASGKDWWWWRLRIRFRKRVVLRKSAPKEQYQEYLRGCALYVDSYPLLGGTAFPEALMLGSKVVGMRGVAWGYSCADDLRSEDVNTFIRDCQALLSENPAFVSRQTDARIRCIQYHAPAAVRHRLDTLIDEGRIVPPPRDQLTQLPSRTAESYWLTRGVSVLPSRKRSSLVRADMRRLWTLHSATFGPLTWSSIKLGYYAYIKKLN